MYQTVESFTAVTLPQQSPRHCATFDEADLNQCQPQVKSAYCQTEMKITAGDLSRNKTHMPKHPSHCAHSIDIPLHPQIFGPLPKRRRIWTCVPTNTLGLNVEEESSLHTDFGAEGHETKNLFGEQIPATSSVVSCGGIGEVTAAGGQRLRHMSIAVPEEKIDAFRVLYCKRSLKKRKSYADGILVVSSRQSTLLNEDGRVVTKSKVEFDVKGIGAFEGEIGVSINSDDYTSGRCFVNQTEATNFVLTEQSSLPLSQCNQNVGKEYEVPKFGSVCGASADVDILSHSRQNVESLSLVVGGDSASLLFTTVPPFLQQLLLPHQKEGVMWLLQQLHSGGGCILADTMGLGKTLQAITLLWTLMISHAKSRCPTGFKTIVACPTTLVGTWKKEFNRWLANRVSPLVAGGNGTLLRNVTASFSCSRSNQVLIASYDELRRINITCGVDLLICDEGHRLRSAKSQTAVQLARLTCRRKLLLSGTPLQNNLNELYSCCHFVCPDALPSERVFAQAFKAPITKGSKINATYAEKKIAKEREAELMTLISKFMLRRNNDILNSTLPRKLVIVIYIPLSPLHRAAYNKLCQLALQRVQKIPGLCLAALTALRSLINVPRGFAQHAEASAAHQDKMGVSHSAQIFPVVKCSPGSERCCVAPQSSEPTENAADLTSLVSNHPGLQETSRKLEVLELILKEMENTSEKVLIVSNSTVILDEVGSFLARGKWKYVRLDGSTPPSHRQGLVDEFNESDAYKIFLLSSKAGGTGLNLTGANHLIHLDPDWNPANDQQAMSRIWRQGQSRPVSIYRLAASNTLEETILKRQLFKHALAKKFVDYSDADTRSWITEDIRQLLRPIPERNFPCPTKAMDAFSPEEQQAPKWLESFYLKTCLDKIYRIELVEDSKMPKA